MQEMTADTSSTVPRTANAAGPTALELLASFRLHLQAENKAPRTIQAYTSAVRLLAGYLAEQGMPLAVASITREHVESFLADQLARLRPTSAASRYRSLQQFFGWAASEGEIAASPMARMSPPAVPDVPARSPLNRSSAYDDTRAPTNGPQDRSERPVRAVTTDLRIGSPT
jgi:site-specific recombinase XerC